MSQSNDFPHDPFEEHVADLLSRTARVARPTPALSQRVRQRLANVDGSLSRPRSAARFWPMVTQFGSIAVATLVVGAVVAVLLTQGAKAPRHTIGAGTASATATVTAPAPACSDSTPVGEHYPYTLPADHSVVINSSATASGVTITIDRAYADATQTVILFHANGATSQGFFSGENMALTDSSGKVYRAISSGSANQLGYPNAQIALFPPLPQSELGVRQHLTFSFDRLTGGPDQSGVVGTPISTVGPWQVPFTITPVAGKSIPVSLPAQTHDGLTIQVESVDIAPAGGGLDGQNGGARIHVRISGLPAKMQLTDVANFSTAFWEGQNGGGQSSSPDSLPGALGCPELDLQYFSGLPILPGFIEVNGEYPFASPNSNDPTTWSRVGPGGSAELDVLFYGPFTDGKMVLTIDGIRISTPESGAANGTRTDLRVAHGPWVFSIPLQRP